MDARESHCSLSAVKLIDIGSTYLHECKRSSRNPGARVEALPLQPYRSHKDSAVIMSSIDIILAS